MDNQKIVAMATFPPRRAGLKIVVDSLLPQCDKLCLYLNGYTEVPEELPASDKLTVVLAGPGTGNPDLGSQGKFFWCGEENGYYLTVDDDIFYPEGYVDYMVHQVDRYSRTAIVGLHGGIFRIRMGGTFPPRGMAKDHRTLYPYDRAVPRDLPVHILGCGVMACYPKVIGLSREACCGPVHSGDDEDIAIWAQKRGVPLIRLKGRNKWVLPNNKIWVLDPLHRRVDYINMADTKIKSWQHWTIKKAPLALTNQTVEPPTPVPVRPPAIPLRTVYRASTPRVITKVTPPAVTVKPREGRTMGDVNLTPSSLEFCNKILSSDALAAILIDRIKNRIPTSVIRMSDGERAFIEHSLGAAPASFMQDRLWLQRYGLLNADLKQVGRDLSEAGMHADFLACTISGLFLPQFKVHHFFPERKQFIDQFFPALWEATGRVPDVLGAGPVLVLHREYARLVPALQKKYQVPAITGMGLNSWGDHERLLKELAGHEASTILVSGGASGKPFCVRIAEQCGKIAIDIGEALTGCWAK